MEDDSYGDPPVGGSGDEGTVNLYDRFFDDIYDYAIRLSQDREISALVIQSSFLRVFRAQAEGTLTDPVVQLFGGAHLDVAERLRDRRGATEASEEPYASIDPARLTTPVEEPVELGQMAWSAAIDLKLNDYELLDLATRRGLSLEQAAGVLGQRPESVQRRLLNVTDGLERSMRARILFVRGRRECLDLDFLLGDGEWSTSLARRISKHAETCLTCQNTLRRLPASTALLAGLVNVPAPAGWKETMYDRLVEALGGEPAPLPLAAIALGGTAAAAAAAAAVAAEPGVEATQAAMPTQMPETRSTLPETGLAGDGGGPFGDGFGAVFGEGPRGPILIALLGGLLAVVVVIGALCATGAFSGDDDDDEPEATETPTVTETEEATGTPSPTVTPTATPTQPPPPTQAPPTSTPNPTSTPPPEPTDTPEPTNTRAPTSTPRPARTNTPVPPVTP